jgi:predicted HicB family RNase H-like nuclease
MPRYRPDDDLRFTLRLDEDLRHELIAAAHRQMRSLNREIKYRLRQSFEQQEAPAGS